MGTDYRAVLKRVRSLDSYISKCEGAGKFPVSLAEVARALDIPLTTLTHSPFFENQREALAAAIEKHRRPTQREKLTACLLRYEAGEFPKPETLQEVTDRAGVSNSLPFQPRYRGFIKRIQALTGKKRKRLKYENEEECALEQIEAKREYNRRQYRKAVRERQRAAYLAKFSDDKTSA